jgi:signal transduction histidine kinase
MMRTMEEIVWATNPANDTLENTVTFLGQYSERLFGGTSIRAFQEIPVELPEHVLPGHVRKNILLAVKEALENSLKHSKATEVWLRVACENAVLRIVIEDNGCGFATDSTRRFGNGLANMKARMEEVQAHCEIAGRPGNGTRVELRIELALS